MAISLKHLDRKTLENIVDNNGNDPSKWNPELQDLFDTTIEPELVSAPISGKVDRFLNPDFHYHWAFDTADRHERVEEMKFVGWEPATTNDVKMCSEASVKSRKKDKPSRDGGEGFSDEIRSGDRLLMKLPMMIWRKNKKAQLMAGFQQAHPQTYGTNGQVMSASSLVPGLKSEMMDPAAIDDTRRRANSQNSVLAKTAKE